MIRILSITETEPWDEIVRSFRDYDVYYLAGYLKGFQVHGDGEPLLVYYESPDLRAICALMKRTIPGCEGWFDLITPYGYGGFLPEGNLSPENLRKLNHEYTSWMKEAHIVSEFVRYHPLLDNARQLSPVFPAADLGPTVAVDLQSKEQIWKNLSPTHRNKIRKARKNGVKVRREKSPELLEVFRNLYNSTMEYRQASSYYFFSPAHYESIHRDLNAHYELFTARYKGRVIAMTIILHANGRMHYHFSGIETDYRPLASMNLLLYEAACWGCEQGIERFHLGGGLGNREDSLFCFKKNFTKEPFLRFAVGKRIVNPDIYSRLLGIRSASDPNFDRDDSFFPLYRK